MWLRWRQRQREISARSLLNPWWLYPSLKNIQLRGSWGWRRIQRLLHLILWQLGVYPRTILNETYQLRSKSIWQIWKPRRINRSFLRNHSGLLNLYHRPVWPLSSRWRARNRSSFPWEVRRRKWRRRSRGSLERLSLTLLHMRVNWSNCMRKDSMSKRRHCKWRKNS